MDFVDLALLIFAINAFALFVVGVARHTRRKWKQKQSWAQVRQMSDSDDPEVRKDAAKKAIQLLDNDKKPAS